MRIMFLMTCVLIGCGGAGASAESAHFPRPKQCYGDESTSACYHRLNVFFREQSIMQGRPTGDQVIEHQRIIRGVRPECTSGDCAQPVPTSLAPQVVSPPGDPVQPAPWSEGDGVSLE
jgi:hypothetical protein